MASEVGVPTKEVGSAPEGGGPGTAKEPGGIRGDTPGGVLGDGIINGGTCVPCVGRTPGGGPCGDSDKGEGFEGGAPDNGGGCGLLGTATYKKINSQIYHCGHLQQEYNNKDISIVINVVGKKILKIS